MLKKTHRANIKRIFQSRYKEVVKLLNNLSGWWVVIGCGWAKLNVVNITGICRILAISPKIPDSPKKTFISDISLPNPNGENKLYINNNRMYYLLSMIIYIMNTINPNHRVKEKFLELLKLYPIIDIKSMGFPNGWEEEPLWK